MITSQRIIIMAIFINLLIGVAYEAYFNPTAYDLYEVTSQTSYLESKDVELQEETTIWGNIMSTATGMAEESTILNGIKGGFIILKIFWRGMIPIPLSREDVNTDLEKIMADILFWFRALFTIIIALEGYLIFKNKKGT